MNKKEALATATFLVFYTGFIFAGFSWMLTAKIDPIKENQVRLDKRMDRIETRMDRMEERIGLEMQEIKSMLGQILVAQNAHHKGQAKQMGKSKEAPKAKPVQRKTASHH